MMVLILQMRNLVYWAVKELARSPTTRKWERQGLSPGLLTCQLHHVVLSYVWGKRVWHFPRYALGRIVCKCSVYSCVYVYLGGLEF